MMKRSSSQLIMMEDTGRWIDNEGVEDQIPLSFLFCGTLGAMSTSRTKAPSGC